MPEQQGETDELFDVKTQFYIGNYQSAINEAQKLKVKATSKNMLVWIGFHLDIQIFVF